MDRPGNNGLPDDGAREASQEAARAVAAASAQLDLALREAAGPVGKLGTDVEQMFDALEQLRARPATAAAPELASLQLRLTSAIQQLQFYDRMFQHLSHVHDYLMSVAGRLGAGNEEPEADRDPSVASAGWGRLRERFYSRLLTEPQRQLFDMMLPADAGSGTRMRERAALGSIELF